MAALGELVSAGFIRCARSLRANGVQALDLMTRDAKQLGRCECPVRREKWAAILEVGVERKRNLVDVSCLSENSFLQKGTELHSGTVSSTS